MEDNQEENPMDFIKQASEERAFKEYQALLEKQRIQQQAIQSIVDRKIRENNKLAEETKKIKSIQDALKKGDKIRWEIINNSYLKGFVKNKLVFEIKKGMTIYNLYVKDISFLKENSKKGYISCSSNIQKIKEKSEKLIL